MNDLIERSYEAIKKRGLITPYTSNIEFLVKINEEFCEAMRAYNGESIERYIEELTDIATVCFMQIKHLNHDPIKEFEKVLIKNEKRANQNTLP